MATLKGQTVAASYQDLVKRADTYAQAGTNIELMDDSGDVQATGLYLESNATTSNVGIGIAVPAYPFDVASSISTWAVRIKNTHATAGGGLYVAAGDDNDAAAFRVADKDDNDKFTIQGSGNVGIGDTAPASTLPASSNATTPKILTLKGVANNTDVGIMIHRSADYAVGMDIWCDTSTGINYIDQRYDNAGGDLRFRTKTAGTAIDAMTIDGDGNVGIGTTSPEYANDQHNALHVLTVGGSLPNNYGSIEIAGDETTDNDTVGFLKFVNSNNSDSSAATDANLGGLRMLVETSDANAGDDSGGHLLFLTKPEEGGVAERMRIDSEGNVGIGVTPEAWSGYSPVLQIGDRGSLAHWENILTNIADNWYYDGADKRIDSGYATRIQLNSNSGTITFETSGTDAADSAVSWATPMTIANSGDVTFTGDLIMADGKGINFAAMTSPADAAGMTAEILDDYEEGNGTPTVALSTSGTVTLSGGETYYYIKVGNIVHYQFEFQTTAISSPVGTLTVSLPFAQLSGRYVAGSLRLYSETFDGVPFVGIESSTSVAKLQCSKSGTSTQDITPTAGTRYYYGSVTYRVN